MVATTRQPVGQAAARWTLLLRPRWVAWHAFAVLSTVGMLLLGDWQLHRAESGNELSWAYTFEWPLFAAFTLYFWIKSLRDELHEHGTAAADAQSASPAAEFTAADTASGPAAAASRAGVGDSAGSLAAASDSGAAATAAPGSAVSPSASPLAEQAIGAGHSGAAASGPGAASWDATRWDAASWAATGVPDDADGSGKPVDVARATPADGDAYVARLMAEVQRQGRRNRR